MPRTSSSPVAMTQSALLATLFSRGGRSLTERGLRRTCAPAESVDLDAQGLMPVGITAESCIASGHSRL